MAIGSTITATGLGATRGNEIAYALSAIFTANDDLRTAQSAANLLHPFGITDSTFHWVKVPDLATRFYVRASTTSTLATVTTSPIVRIYGCIMDPADSGSTATTAKMLRLDSYDANATGTTLTLVASRTGMQNDGTNYFSNVAPTTISFTGGYPTQGCRYVGVLCETAANIATSVAVTGDVIFMA